MVDIGTQVGCIRIRVRQRDQDRRQSGKSLHCKHSTGDVLDGAQVKHEDILNLIELESIFKHHVDTIFQPFSCERCIPFI